jgi:hypothetical protein
MALVHTAGRNRENTQLIHYERVQHSAEAGNRQTPSDKQDYPIASTCRVSDYSSEKRTGGQ